MRRLLSLLLLLTLLAGCGSTQSTKPATPDKVRVAVWSNQLSEQTNLYAAHEFGWFKEQAIEYTFVPGKGGGDALQQVIAGNAEIAFANLEPVLFAMEKGAKLKIIWNIYPQNVFNIVSLKSRNITSVQDLKGKKVGVYGQASGTRYNLLVMLKAAGLKETDVEVVPVGPANFAPLKEGKIDAYAATDTGLWGAQAAGLGEVNVLWARDVLNTPSDIFVVTEAYYNKNKDLLRRFLTAYKQGTQWMLDNPEKAAELAVKYATDGQDPKRNLEIIKLRNASTISAGTKKNGLGWFDEDVLVKVESTFRELGITSAPVNMKSLYTNEFVKK